MEKYKQLFLQGCFYTLTMWMVFTLLDYWDTVDKSFQEIAVEKIPISLMTGAIFTLYLFWAMKDGSKE